MNAVFNAVANVVSAVGDVLWCFHVSCLWLGWAVTTVYLGIFRGILALSCNLLLAVSILCEDFFVFVEDVGDVFERCVTDVVDGTWLLVESASSTGLVVVTGVIQVPSSLLRSVASYPLGSSCVNVVCLVRDAVLLIGLIIWEALAVVIAAVCFLNEAPYVLCILFIRAVDRLVFSALCMIQTHQFKSITGLCIGYAAFVAAKKIGLMPDEGFHVLFSHVCRWSCHRTVDAALALTSLCRGASLRLHAALASVLIFLLRQSRALKTSAWWLIRGIIVRTPTDAALKIKLEKETASSLCVICMDRRRDVIILNCRHFLLCRTCAVTVAVNAGDCPICRCPIENMISVFT